MKKKNKENRQPKLRTIKLEDSGHNKWWITLCGNRILNVCTSALSEPFMLG